MKYLKEVDIQMEEVILLVVLENAMLFLIKEVVIGLKDDGEN